jgi:N-methyl-L-proline demethylase
VQRCVDQVVVEHGTIAVDELYSDLRAGSLNLGETDPDRLVAVRPQDQAHNPAGRYRLFRIGDAVAHRNVHAAIYDARRLCLAL